MRKINILLISSFFVFQFFAHHVYAQTPTSTSSISITGFTCGNAYSQNPEERKCCQKAKEFENPMNNYKDVIVKIPIIGDKIIGLIDGAVSPILQTQRSDDFLIPCPFGVPSNATDPNCICLSTDKITPTPAEALVKTCNQYFKKTSKELGSCLSCAKGNGVWTSIGCIYGDLSRLIMEKVFGFGLGLAGGLSLLCIIFAAFQMQASGGSPEKIKKAQELLTSCITGLILIVFSIFILRLIGVSIFKIPGFY